MPAEHHAEQFISKLQTYRSTAKQKRYEQSFKPDEDDEFSGTCSPSWNTMRPPCRVWRCVTPSNTLRKGSEIIPGA